MKTHHNYLSIQNLWYIFLFTTLFKLVAFSFQKKVANLYEQGSRPILSAIGAYWNPWVL